MMPKFVRDSLELKPILKLKQADVVPTSICNMRCKHCFIGDIPQEELTYDEVKQVYEILKENGITRVNIWGGEITIRPDFYQLIETALLNFDSVSIQTNGTIETMLPFMLKSSKPEIRELYRNLGIHVSIEGSPEDDAEIRGKFHLRRVFNSLPLLAEAYGTNVSIRTTIFKNNKLSWAIELALKLGVKWIGIRFKELGRGSQLKDLIPDEERLAKVYYNIKELRKEYNEPIDRIMVDDSPFYIYDDYYYQKYYEYFAKRGYICPWGRRILVNQRGDVYPCPYTMNDKYYLGNIFNDEFDKILKNYNKLLKWRIELMRDEKYIDKCRICPLRRYCGGGCTIYADINPKGYLGDPYCPIPILLKK